MLEVIVVVVFVAAGIAAAGKAIQLGLVQQDQRSRLWTAALESAGLRDAVIVPSAWGSGSVTARSGSLWVRVEGVQIDKDVAGTKIEINDTGRGLGGVTVRREDAVTELAKLLGKRELEIGDPSFDDTFFIGGSSSLALAFLDRETRAVLFRLNQEGKVEIGNPGIGLVIPESSEERLLSKVSGLLLELARRLRDRDQTAARLAENARNDSWAATRLASLLCLVREFGEHPLVAPTLRAACDDRSPEVRLRAASVLGSEGVDTLLGMTEDLGLADVWQAAAVAALGRRLPTEQAEALLERALLGQRPETARACVDALRLAGQAAVQPLVKTLGVEAGVVAAAAARALGALQASAAEGPLLRALWRDAPGLRVAAAEALGRSASAAAVLPLKQAADRYSGTEFRRAARQAIAEIQARIPGATPGQLSLASAEAGQLSLAAPEAGRLSLPEVRAGQVSIAEARSATSAKPGKAPPSS